MAIPIRNQILEKIKEKEGLTDKELNKILVKDEIGLQEILTNLNETKGLF